MGLSRRADALLAEYDRFHRHPSNKAAHYVGIPLLVLGLLGMLAQWQWVGTWPARLDAGIAVGLLAGAWYVRLDWRLGLDMLLAVYWLHAAALLLPLWAHVSLFGAGWIPQLVGHARFERNRPAFATNLRHLLVGPLWIVARCVGAVPSRARSQA
jgi:uncharacterized membrane protein YGL010W